MDASTEGPSKDVILFGEVMSGWCHDDHCGVRFQVVHEESLVSDDSAAVRTYVDISARWFEEGISPSLWPDIPEPTWFSLVIACRLSSETSSPANKVR